jgi:hypothetical protein
LIKELATPVELANDVVSGFDERIHVMCLMLYTYIYVLVLKEREREATVTMCTCGMIENVFLDAVLMLHLFSG